MRQLLVETEGQTTEVALTDDEALLDFRRYSLGAVESEQIYLGVVDRVAKGMNAAFVRLTETQNGFLPFSETKQPVKGGDRVLVQVKKPPVQSKDCYLTQDISLAGGSVILLPLSPFCAVSKRIEDEKTRAAMLERAKTLVPKGMGLVMRHDSGNMPDDALRGAVDSLLAVWRSVLEDAKRLSPPCLVRDSLSPVSRALRDFSRVDSAVVSDEKALDECARLHLSARLSAHPFDLAGVHAQLKKALAHRIWLKSGGFLVIDPCEALTVIDVNTGKFVGTKAGSETTFLTLNLEAAKEIARLIRLRNMGGIVLVDFIDMAEEKSRETLLSALRDALASDPVKCVVHGFTSLGLMEITRKKAAQTLTPGSENLLCPFCHGTGLKQEDS